MISSRTLKKLNINNLTSNGSGILTKDETALAKYSYVPIEETVYTPEINSGYTPQNTPQIYSKILNKKSFKPDLGNEGIIKNAIMYDFGIDNLTVGYSTSHEVCGFISKKINIGTCSYIQLEVSTTEGDTALEYSIIDGASETPILPIGETKIVGEKLFQNLPTRFTVDKTQNISVKKDNEPTEITLDDIEQNIIFDADSVYTIDYTPKNISDKFFPSEKKIQVKIIHREYPFTIRPKIIKSVVIKKFGGDAPWHIQG